MDKIALILGASGHFGASAAEALAADGWQIRRYDRAKDDINQVAMGADIIVNGLNPPGYRNWAAEIPRITAMAIDAAKASGATLIVPGNVYVFGSQPGVWDETTPHRPDSRKGAIRIAMERAYREAASDGVRTILLRAGDFIDPAATGNWIGQILGGIGKGKFTWPGNPDIPHAWAYLPDLGRAVAMLADRRQVLAAYDEAPFPGYSLTGRQMLAVLQKLTPRPLRMRAFPWWLVGLASPFWPLGRELREMRYLWEVPHSLSATKFAQLLPEFVATPIETVLAAVSAAHVHPDQPVARSTLLA